MTEQEVRSIRVKTVDRFALHSDLTVCHYSTEIMKLNDVIKTSPIILLTLLLLSGCEFLEIDKCLDRGSKWSHEENTCIFEETTQLDRTHIKGHPLARLCQSGK